MLIGHICVKEKMTAVHGKQIVDNADFIDFPVFYIIFIIEIPRFIIIVNGMSDDELKLKDGATHQENKAIAVYRDAAESFRLLGKSLDSVSCSVFGGELGQRHHRSVHGVGGETVHDM